MRLSVLPFIIFLIASCSTTDKTLPPSKEFFEKIKATNFKEPQPEEDWEQPEREAIVFSKANFFKNQGNLHHACQRYRFLKKDQQFPLKDLAFVRAIETCRYPKPILMSKWDIEGSQLPSWLQEEYAQVSLKEAKRIKSNKYQAYFYYLNSKYKKSKKEKEADLLMALKHAKRTKDKSIIEEYQKYLYQTAPRFQRTSKDSQEMYAISRDYERVRNFSKARSGYRKLIRSKTVPFDLKLKAWNRTRLSYKNQRRKPEYVSQTKNMGKWLWRLHSQNPKDDEIFKEWVESQMTFARATWTEGNLRQGKRVLLKTLKKNIKDKNQVATIYWILGKMSLEKRRTSDALQYFILANKFPITDKDLKEKLGWSIGWNYFLEKDYKNAARNFKLEQNETENIFFLRRLKFWEAYSHKKSGNLDEAHDIWEDLADENAFDYYGIISHALLKRPFKGIEKNDEPEYFVFPEFEWLISVGEYESAARFLKSIQGQYRNVDDIKKLLPLYTKAQYYDGGIHKFFRIKSNERPDVLYEFPNIVFPDPYQPELGKAEDRFKIESEFLRSIIRQESAYNTHVRSYADAFGLMQLTPERAEILSHRYSIPYKNHSDLYRPADNILFGAALLKELKKKFKDNFVSTVASYNASEQAIKGWYKTRFEGDYLVFIERIPYEETRNYVKLVLRNYVTYKRMSTNGPFQFDLGIFKNF